MGKHDVVIIGSGLGGLECGVMLSQEGYRVRVLEKNRNIGGCLQSFRRGGHVLDTGIHYVGGLDEGQILNQYFKYLGVRDSLNVTGMDPEAFDTVVLGGKEYDFGMGYERFAENMKGYFPSEAGNIDRFCSLLKEIGGTMSIENLRKGLISNDAMKYLERSAHGTIDEMCSDPVLRSVLAGTSPLYAGIREKTSLYHYGMINHSFIESAYRFAGGSQQLADALARRIRDNGGEVLTGKEVTAIKTRERHATGVEVNGGEYFEAGYVISDTHPAVTFELIDKTPLIKKANITRLRSLENSCGIFSVYLVMKKGRMPYLNTNFYIYEGRDTWRIEYDMDRDIPRVILFNMQVGEREQTHADLVSLLCPIEFRHFTKWRDTSVGNRGGDYLEFKAHLAERAIEFVSHRFPGLKDAIERIYTTSPLSYRDYIASPDGSAYGIVKDCRSPLTTLIPINTRFDNLLLTGQNINVHGVLGVSVTAALTCSKLLGAEYIAKKIGNA